MTPTPVLAIVGRPNVGKSTLFNRLTASRAALVADIAGLTRDRHYGRGVRGDRSFVVIDTGGFEPVAREGLTAAMARQTRQAVIEADLVLFVVDGRAGVTGHDREIAAELRRTAARWLLVVNKTEGMIRDRVTAEFHELGLGDPYAVSAAHGDAVGEVVDLALERIDESRGLRGGAAAPDAGGADGRPAGAEEGSAREGDPVAVRGEPGTGRGDGASAGVSAGADAGADVGADAEADAADPGPSAAEGGPAAGPAPVVLPPRRIRIAIVGRPNGGKSTLINALVGEERVIAFDLPGTTRDAVAIDFERNGRPYTLVDTAGLRRRGKIHETIEKFSVVKTLQAIEDCNVCVLVLDAEAGITDQDASIAGYILEAGRALVVAVNKWDRVPAADRDRLKDEFDRKLHFLRFARVHMISALHGQGLGALLRSAEAAYAAAISRLSTPKLTRSMNEAVARQAPPRRGVIRPKLRYAHQGGQNPPVVVIHGNALDAVPDTYRRYLEGWFREHFKLEGTPLRIEFRSQSNPYVR